MEIFSCETSHTTTTLFSPYKIDIYYIIGVSSLCNYVILRVLFCHHKFVFAPVFRKGSRLGWFISDNSWAVVWRIPVRWRTWFPPFLPWSLRPFPHLSFFTNLIVCTYKVGYVDRSGQTLRKCRKDDILLQTSEWIEVRFKTLRQSNVNLILNVMSHTHDASEQATSVDFRRYAKLNPLWCMNKRLGNRVSFPSEPTQGWGWRGAQNLHDLASRVSKRKSLVWVLSCKTFFSKKMFLDFLSKVSNLLNYKILDNTKLFMCLFCSITFLYRVMVVNGAYSFPNSSQWFSLQEQATTLTEHLIYSITFSVTILKSRDFGCSTIK